MNEQRPSNPNGESRPDTVLDAQAVPRRGRGSRPGDSLWHWWLGAEKGEPRYDFYDRTANLAGLDCVILEA